MDQSLYNLLINIAPRVYFHPPENIKMTYPCIVCTIAGDDTVYADDVKYIQKMRYNVVHMDINPENDAYKQLSAIRGSSFQRAYNSKGLHHTLFTITK